MTQKLFQITRIYQKHVTAVDQDAALELEKKLWSPMSKPVVVQADELASTLPDLDIAELIKAVKGESPEAQQ